MSKVNIQGKEDIEDMFYRYTMNRPIINKNKTKYTIQNIDTIAKDLSRDPEHIIAFLKKKWGTAIKYSDSVAITTKAIDENEFMMAIREYIDVYVLCSLCKNPETEFTTNGKKLYKECKACANRSQIKE